MSSTRLLAPALDPLSDLLLFFRLCRYLAEMRTFGWTLIDHSVLETRKTHGIWYPSLVDNVLLSLGQGFVGSSFDISSFLTSPSHLTISLCSSAGTTGSTSAFPTSFFPLLPLSLTSSRLVLFSFFLSQWASSPPAESRTGTEGKRNTSVFWRGSLRGILSRLY